MPLLLACCAASAALARAARAAAATAAYEPWDFNKACRYSAPNIAPGLFLNGIDGGLDYLFPLETSRAVNRYRRPWEACFGPKDTYDIKMIADGLKLPCSYRVNAKGNYDYEEEHACEVLVKSNCYCYALDRFVGSYCEPGLGGTGQAFQLPVLDCSKPVAGVLADGGRAVDRATVYQAQPSPAVGHYIALAIKPPAGPDDTGDFHFWRLDTNGAWSYKAGDTLVRNTLRNGTQIHDIEEDDVARGVYSKFCGYFHVVPATHKLVGNQFWYSNLPTRYKMWRGHGVRSTVQPLAQLPAGWLAAYHDYFAESGWEDVPAGVESGFPAGAAAGGVAGPNKERALVPRGGRGPRRSSPHWYSVRPRPPSPGPAGAP